MNDGINTKRTELANQMAAAGAALLDFTGTACAMAAIPDTEPQQYVAAGTPENIAAILPATICPQRRQKHGERPTEPLQFDSPAATSGDAPDLQRLKALALAATPGPWIHDIEDNLIYPASGERIIDITCRSIDVGREQRDNNASFVAAANPAVVLGLIARIESTEAPAPSRPTEISGRLRQRASEAMPNQDDAKLMLTAADECDRFYGGMMAWKKTAQKKDADWNAERMARVDERCAARAASPATASGDELPPLPATEYKLSADSKAASLYDLEAVQSIQREAYELGKARAAVSVATKPTADLPDENECWVHIYPSDLKRMERTETHATVFSVAVGRAGEVSVPLYTAEQVQSLLATKPAAATAVPEKWLNFVRNLSNLQPEVYTSHGLLTVTRAFCNTAADLLAVTPAASTTGAAQTAEQVRDQLLNEVDGAIDQVILDLEFDVEERSGAISCRTAIRALRPTPTHSLEAGDE